MALDRLLEWYAAHPNHRYEKAADRRHARSTRARYSRKWFEEIYAEALAEHEARSRRIPSREPDYDAEMKLPAGKTCGDCRHARRCLALGFTSSVDRTGCDFHPRRFSDLGFRDDGWRVAALEGLLEKFGHA